MKEIMIIKYKIFVNIHYKTKKIFIFLKVLSVNWKLFCNLMGQGQGKRYQIRQFKQQTNLKILALICLSSKSDTHYLQPANLQNSKTDNRRKKQKEEHL
jgi:hypothetical protein